MSTIAVGTTVTLPIVGHESYTVVSNHNTNWSAKFTPTSAQSNAGAGTGRTFGPAAVSQTFGPYGVPGVLTITTNADSTSTPLTYTYQSAMFAPDAGLLPGVVIVSSAAPVDADGRPDGTIYIQTV